jgi:hypothetical protein
MENNNHSLADAERTKPLPTPDGHLIYVNIEGAWCYINGESGLSFKTRGNNEFDLFHALAKYDVDYWQSDFDFCVSDMAKQLQTQASAKRANDMVLLAPGIFKIVNITSYEFKGTATN